MKTPRAITWISLLVALTSCLPLFDCGNEVLSTHPGPGGRIRAVVFLRDCGAASSWSTNVSVLGSSRLGKNATGNVLVASGGEPGRPGVTIRWLERRVLEVTVEKGMDVSSKESRVGDIEVRFVEI
jgi:hypothetical protein